MLAGMRIGIALFEGAEELDFAGPWEVLAAWARMWPDDGVEVFLVAESLEPVTCAKGMRVVPDTTWADAGGASVSGNVSVVASTPAARPGQTTVPR